MSRGVSHPQLAATAVLIGTAVGAGIFGIPYVIAQSGAYVGAAHIIIIGGIAALTLLAYAEVVTRTRGTHQFAGYAKQLLGQTGQWLAVGSLLFGLYAALIAYTIEIGHFLYELLNPTLGGSELLYGVLFWVLGSAAIVVGLSLIARLEELIVFAIAAVLLVLLILALPHISLSKLTTVNPSRALLPYGVVLFAFGSASIIPELRRLLQRSRRLAAFPKVIISGMTLTGLLYLAFALLVVGTTGESTSQSAIDGLAQVIGPQVLVLGGIFAIFAMGSSFLVGGLALKQLYQYDFRLSRSAAILLTLLPPLLIYLLNFVSFVQVIGIAGAVTGGFQGVIIWELFLAARKQSDRTPEFKLPIPKFAIRLVQIAYIAGVAYSVLRTISDLV